MGKTLAYSSSLQVFNQPRTSKLLQAHFESQERKFLLRALVVDAPLCGVVPQPYGFRKFLLIGFGMARRR